MSNISDNIKNNRRRWYLSWKIYEYEEESFKEETNENMINKAKLKNN